MTIATIGVLYLATGGAIAIVIAAVRRRLSPGDAAWLIGLWPLYAPLQLARGAPDPDPGLAHDLLAAIDRAQGSPLASVLPDVDSVRALGARLRDASARRAELDDVLARPDFDPARAAARARELAAHGQAAAAATAELRVRTIGQLHALRERVRRELDEVGELVAQLVAQAELVRLQPAIAHSSGELVRELVARVEGLGDLFADEAALDPEKYGEPVVRCP